MLPEKTLAARLTPRLSQDTPTHTHSQHDLSPRFSIYWPFNVKVSLIDPPPWRVQQHMQPIVNKKHADRKQ